jgi:hypothetical protein
MTSCGSAHADRWKKSWYRGPVCLETIRGGPVAGVPLWTKLMNSARLGMEHADGGGCCAASARTSSADWRVRQRSCRARALACACRQSFTCRTSSRGRRSASSAALLTRWPVPRKHRAPIFPTDKVVVTGYPVRPELRAAAANAREPTALATFELGIPAARYSSSVAAAARAASIVP